MGLFVVANYFAARGVESENKLWLGGPCWKTFSFVYIDHVYNVWRFRCLSDLCLYWESDLTIGEVSNKYVKRSTWPDVYDSSPC